MSTALNKKHGESFRAFCVLKVPIIKKNVEPSCTERLKKRYQ